MIGRKKFDNLLPIKSTVPQSRCVLPKKTKSKMGIVSIKLSLLTTEFSSEIAHPKADFLKPQLG